MKRPPPRLNFIRSFECAAQHLSFTAAGKDLGFTQAAISTHIRALEQNVGRPLLHHASRSFSYAGLSEEEQGRRLDTKPQQHDCLFAGI